MLKKKLKDPVCYNKIQPFVRKNKEFRPEINKSVPKHVEYAVETYPLCNQNL